MIFFKNKKVFRNLTGFLILCFIWLLPCQASAQQIRIGLKYGSSSVTECTLQNSSGFLLMQGDELVSELMETKLLLQFTPEQTILVSDGQTSAEIYNYAKGKEPLNLIPSDGGTLLIDNKEYRGSARFYITDTGFSVINVLDLEDYLKGVVASEMPSGWHKEALKAQAICARNYAITNLNRYESQGFDLDDTINSQVYKGVSAETPSTNLAIEETKGLLLTYQEKPASTFFYSSSGGHTESAKYVWGNDSPYLIGVEDPYDTSKEWTVPYTPEEIKEKLAGIQVQIGEITDLVVLETSPAGRIIDLKIVGTEGEHRLKLEKPRSLFNLRSNLFTITKQGGDVKPVSVITASGIEERSLNAPILTATELIPASPTIPTEYIFHGTGYGHGVGMSQYGAKGMAEAGYTCEQILMHYFVGTTLEIISQ